MTLKKRLNKLELDILKTYKKLTPEQKLKIYNTVLDEDFTLFNAVAELIETDLLDTLPTIYCNGVDGKERKVHVLEISKHIGLKCYSATGRVELYSFSDINSLYDKIAIIELLENYSLTQN